MQKKIQSLISVFLTLGFANLSLGMTGAMLLCAVYGGDKQEEQMAPKDPEAANFASPPSALASH